MPRQYDELYLREEVQAAAKSRTIKLTLKTSEIRLIPDALHSLFGIESAGGALYFMPASGVSVTARTYSRKSNGGTFGFGMQAIDFFNATGPRFPLTFAGAFPGEHYRTNVLLTDTSGRGTSAELRAFGVNGVMSSSPFSVVAPTGGVTQYNGLGAALGLVSNDAGGLFVQLTGGTAIPTVVAIDNRTNDATYFPPDLASMEERVIPVIGHLDGANGSRFRTDLYLLNPTNEPRTAFLEAKQWDSPMFKTTPFTLLPQEARVIVDALPTLFGMTGLARLRLGEHDAGEAVRMTSRTYTVEESGATYGSLIPPLNSFQIARRGERLEILGVNAGGNFRANLGLVDLSSSGTHGNTDVRVWIIDDTPRILDTFTLTVPNSGGVQFNDIFAARRLTPPNASLFILEVLDGGGRIGAYATLTDNLTNDTTYLGAHLGAQPN